MARTSKRKWMTLRKTSSSPKPSIGENEVDELRPDPESEPEPEPTPVSEAPFVSLPVLFPDPLPEPEVEVSPNGVEALEAVEETILESRFESNAVLVVHPLASSTRLIRETLEHFTEAKLFSTSDPLRGFELALQRPYTIFLFAMELGDLSGPLLYELISKAYAAERGPRLLAPGVVYIREKDDPPPPVALTRDVRVKGVLTKPLRIERLLELIADVIEVKDPTMRT